MNESVAGIAAACLWSIICTLIDKKASTTISQDENTYISPNPNWVIAAAIVIGTVCSLIAPENKHIVVAVITTALCITAYADIKHKLIWEEIALPTLLVIMGVQAFYGNGENAAWGSAVVGGVFITLYFTGFLLGKEMGFGDLLPITALGAVYGTRYALIGIGIGTVILIIVTIAKKATKKQIPMGPGLAIAGVVGVILERVLPNIVK